MHNAVYIIEERSPKAIDVLDFVAQVNSFVWASIGQAGSSILSQQTWLAHESVAGVAQQEKATFPRVSHSWICACTSKLEMSIQASFQLGSNKS